MDSFTIGYPIHNKSHMIDEIINGLISSFDNDERIKEYIFILDGCTDNSEEVLNNEIKKLEARVSVIKTDNLFQLKTNNILMEKFNTDWLIIFQDDMVLTYKELLNDTLKLYSKYGEKLGLIGCRDGFGESFSNMYGSEFSVSKRTPLSHGEYKEVMMLNIGPLIFRKKLIEKIGFFDEIYGVGGYEESEFCLKCKYEHGLVNIVLGIDLIHSKYDHKNKNKVFHTDEKTLINQLRPNNQIFNNRWKMAKL